MVSMPCVTHPDLSFLPDDHHSCRPLRRQKEQNSPVSRLRQEYSLKSKHISHFPNSIIRLSWLYFSKLVSVFLPDFSSPIAVCGKPYNRPGEHQKTQVSSVWSLSHLVFSDPHISSPCSFMLSSQKHFFQSTHVYSITEIHHIDDNDFGSIYIKVSLYFVDRPSRQNRQ